MNGRRLERLGPDQQLDELYAGSDILDRWLRVYALACQQMDVARTFVLIDAEHLAG